MCAVLALAGCGGGGGESAPPPAPPVSPPVVPVVPPAPAAPPKALIVLGSDAGLPTLGQEITLSGAGSTDAVSYAWSIQAKPADSAVMLVSANGATLSFTPDRLGGYVLRLRVTSAAGATSEQDLTVNVSNRMPVAVLDKTSAILLTGGAVSVSGGLSYDEDGDALSYAWSLDSKPADSAAVVDKPNGADLIFSPDRAGNYVLMLKVSDGKRSVTTRFEVKVLSQLAGSTALPFTPLVARYSKALDRVVMVSSAPDALKIVDPFGGVTKTVLLPSGYKAMALSPDGKLAAVLHEGVLTLVDLTAATVVRSSSTGGSQTEVFLTNAGVAFLTGQSGGQWNRPPVTVLDARSGVLTSSGDQIGFGYFYGTMHGVYSSLNNKGFVVSEGLSPVDISYFTVDAASNTVLKAGDSPYHGDYPISAPLFLSNKQDVLFTAAGTFFRTDTLNYVGKLTQTGWIASLSQSSSLETLAIVANSTYPNSTQTYPASYKRYVGELMQFSGDLALPVIDGLPSYGREIFHSSGGSHVALVQTGGALQNAAGLKFYLIYR